jgi:hypothetical protein
VCVCVCVCVCRTLGERTGWASCTYGEGTGWASCTYGEGTCNQTICIYVDMSASEWLSWMVWYGFGITRLFWVYWGVYDECKSWSNGVNLTNGVHAWTFVCGCTGVTFRPNLCCWGVKYVSRYVTATTGINIKKCIISLLEQTGNKLSKDDKSELKTKLQGIKDLSMWSWIPKDRESELRTKP